MSKTISVGSLKAQVSRFAVGQALFVILATRSTKHRSALAVDIARDPMLRLAKRYRTGGEPARFPSANVVLARHIGGGELEIVEKQTTHLSADMIVRVRVHGIKDLALQERVLLSLMNNRRWTEVEVSVGTIVYEAKATAEEAVAMQTALVDLGCPSSIVDSRRAQ